MNTLFGDSFFFVAYLNPKEAVHDRAVEYLTRSPDRIVTTSWVLAEVGNFLAEYPSRRLFIPLVRQLRSEPRIRILPASDKTFNQGLELYGRRRDKRWSVTDCISFVVMQDEGITEALTGDHHFEQAGFTILLKAA